MKLTEKEAKVYEAIKKGGSVVKAAESIGMSLKSFQNVLTTLRKKKAVTRNSRFMYRGELDSYTIIKEEDKKKDHISTKAVRNKLSKVAAQPTPGSIASLGVNGPVDTYNLSDLPKEEQERISRLQDSYWRDKERKATIKVGMRAMV